jgi:integrase
LRRLGRDWLGQYTSGAALRKQPAPWPPKHDLPPLPANLTPHSLRRTFATVLYALGEPHPIVMADMGRTSPDLTLRVYAQAMRLTDSERGELVALMGGEKARKGTNGAVVPMGRGRTRAA